MKLIKTTLTVLFFFFFCSSVFASDPFIVSGIRVDASGKTPVKAQVKAIRAGQAKAADILLKVRCQLLISLAPLSKLQI